MALRIWGFIYTGEGCDPARTRVVTGSETCRLIAVGVERPEQGIAAARELVADGVQLIELCGGFGPVWTGQIIEAIGRAVPVGMVAYGPEAVDQVHAIFA
jgi:hypothetical protein